LHLPVRGLLVRAVSAEERVDESRLRSSLVRVLGWPLHGAIIPADYRSPLWLHQRLLDECARDENLLPTAKSRLRILVRYGDENWRPRHPSLALQALLVPGDILTESGDVLTESGDVLTESGNILTESGNILTESDLKLAARRGAELVR